jgi:diadenosine tetraphosphatase ApaH/serine/threonine PP2A family protein phosphatase
MLGQDHGGSADPAMKLALLADIHANLEALTACLASAQEQGAEAFAFLGDLVGYGADPGAVVALVREHAERGAVVVRGNHDAAVVATGSETMNAAAEQAIEWTRSRLDPEQLRFLAGLPLVVRRDPCLFVHASAEAPAQWTYVSDPLRAAQSLQAAGDAGYVFCGHVHEPVLYYTNAARRPMPFRPVPGVAIPVPARRRWLAIVGSAGQPRDGNTAACYAMLDSGREQLTFHRVPYDWQAAAAKVRAAGLPERLAARLAHGE